MLRFFPTALFLIVLVVGFKSVENIKCYVCRSDQNTGCTEELNASLAQECPKRPNAFGEYCRKIKQQLHFRGEKDYTTIRECAYEKSKKNCYLTDWSTAAFMTTCECDTDLCNGSPRGAAAAGLVAAVVSLPLLIHYVCKLANRT